MVLLAENTIFFTGPQISGHGSSATGHFKTATSVNLPNSCCQYFKIIAIFYLSAAGISGPVLRHNDRNMTKGNRTPHYCRLPQSLTSI